MMGVYLDNFGWRDFMLQFVETLNEFIQPKHKNLTLEYHTSYIIRYNETDQGNQITLDSLIPDWLIGISQQDIISMMTVVT